MSNLSKKLFFLMILVMAYPFWNETFAQGAPPPATPIDGGISLLLIAGGLYGVRKLYKNVKE